MDLPGITGPPRLLAEALAPVADVLHRVPGALRARTGEPGAFLAPAVRRLTIDTSGKHLRAGLVLSFAGVAAASDEALAAAVLVELVHAGSLYHDDVIDAASERRGRPSANAEFGMPVAVVSGDYLLARASRVAAGLGGPVAAWTADTVVELCRGEAEEIALTGNIARTQAEYLSCVAGKTGALMGLACRLGAWCVGATPGALEQAARAGREFGVAFQIVDDLLDVCGPESDLGRLPGADLAQGVWTLPVILGLRVDAGLLEDLPGSAPEVAACEVAARLARCGALHGAHATAARALDVATELAPVLEPLAHWLVARADLALEEARVAASEAVVQ